MLSIGDQARQLADLAGQIPAARFSAIDTALGKIGSEVHAILGQTPSAAEISDLIQQTQGQARAATQEMGQLEKTLADLSAYHRG